MADTFAPFYRSDVKAFCMIGETTFAISQYGVRYRLDSIPEATVTIPIGRGTGGVTQNSSGVLSNLPPFTPFKIFLTLTPQPGERGDNPNAPGISGTVQIFDGFISSPGHHRTHNATGLSVSGFGASGGLAGSTRLIQSVVQAVPANSARLLAVNFGSVRTASHLYQSMAQFDAVDNDIWGAGIKLMMEAAMRRPSVFTEPNIAAQLALQRINQGSKLPLRPLQVSQLVPASEAPFFKRGLQECLAQLFFGSWASGSDVSRGGDFWDALMMLRNVFVFHFVPGVLEDSIAPITPGLAGAPHVTFEPNEYFSIQRNVTTDEKFYAYTTKVGLFSYGFVESPFNDTSTIALDLGFASIADMPGQTVLYPAPSFLIPPPFDARATMNPGGGVPDAASDAIKVAGAQSRDAALRSYFSRAIGDNYARAILHERFFAHRALELSGRVRVDVAPGSLVRVNTIGENEGDGEALFGIVQSVTLSGGTSASGSGAKTDFSISHVRSEQEHEDQSFTTPGHPFYGAAWVGGALI